MPDHHAALQITGLANSLRSCALFAGLPMSDLEAIALFSRTVPLRKGQILFRAGEKTLGFYVVQTGTINIYRIGAGGREQVIHLFRAGESFAEVALASDTGYPADARAEQASQVILVPKQEMLALIRKRPEFALRMLGSMSQHLRVLVASLDDLRLKDVETRLINWLLKRCPKSPGAKPVSVEIGMTKTMLAAELSTRNETLSRTLASLRDAKLIAVRGKRIEILQPQALHRLFLANLGE